MSMDPEAIQCWGDANRAYLALEDEVAALFEAEASTPYDKDKKGA